MKRSARRTFLLSGLGASAALVVGWGVLPARSRQGAADTLEASLAGVDGAVGLNGWIAVASDGGVLLAMNRSEMGQGVHTALAMLVADELDLPLARVRLVPAGFDSLYGNVATFKASLPFHPSDTEAERQPLVVRATQWVVEKLVRELGVNLTGGSASVADAWEPLRLAAATARAQLLGAASLQWRLPVAELTVTDGVVRHASGPAAHYGEFARFAAATPPGDVEPKRPDQRRLVGTAAPRTDVAAKSDGSARFGLDVRRPGQVYAVVRHCPMQGGSPGAVDVGPAMRLAGVERVVRLGPYAGSTAALAVVGRSSWHALQGARALRVEWQAPPGGTVDSADVLRALERRVRDAAAAGAGYVFHRRGEPDAVDVAGTAGERQLEQLYRAPYLAHATMEPINCTVQVTAGRVDVWVPTQVPGLVRRLAAEVADVGEDAVAVHTTYLGGGFGRRLEIDMVGQAVRIALETGGRPVQLLWPREEDFGHDFYRPAGVALLRARLGADGLPTSFAFTSAGDAVTPRWMERALPGLGGPVDFPDKTTAEGLFDLPYGVPNQRMAHVATRSGVPVGFWRSVGHSHNAFFSESFVDELAYAAGRDPVAYRMALLDHAPRHAAVLKLAAARAGWGNPLPAGRARGVALHESFGSVVAQIAEVEVEAGRPRVRRVVCAADVGTVVNPDIVAQQMESGILDGLQAALHGRVDIDASRVRQINFGDQPVLRLADAPTIEVHLVKSTRHPSGAGEPGTPPIAPAVANALFVLTGRRLRDLPLAET